MGTWFKRFEENMRNEFLIHILSKPILKFIHHQKFQEEVLKEFPGFSIHH